MNTLFWIMLVVIGIVFGFVIGIYYQFRVQCRTRPKSKTISGMESEIESTFSLVQPGEVVVLTFFGKVPDHVVSELRNMLDMSFENTDEIRGAINSFNGETTLVDVSFKKFMHRASWHEFAKHVAPYVNRVRVR